MERNCSNCKHEHKGEFDLPCVKCRCTALPATLEYGKRPFLWEAKSDLVIPEGEAKITLEPDMVNHPSHYCQEGSMECIDEMLAVFGVEAVAYFCLLNVWKYRKRAVHKNGEEDLKKSDWYMKKYLELKGDLR